MQKKKEKGKKYTKRKKKEVYTPTKKIERSSSKK